MRFCVGQASESRFTTRNAMLDQQINSLRESMRYFFISVSSVYKERFSYSSQWQTNFASPRPARGGPGPGPPPAGRRRHGPQGVTELGHECKCDQLQARVLVVVFIRKGSVTVSRAKAVTAASLSLSECRRRGEGRRRRVPARARILQTGPAPARGHGPADRGPPA